MIALRLLVLAALVLAPLAAGSHDDALVPVVAAAVNADGSLLVFEASADRSTVSVSHVVNGVRSEPDELLRVPDTHYVKDLHAVTRGEQAAVLVISWKTGEDTTAAAELAHLIKRETAAEPWEIVPLPGHEHTGNTLSLAAADAGAWFTLDADMTGVDLLRVESGTLTRHSVATDPAFADVATDGEGVPHVCTGSIGRLIEWTPTGERVMLAGMPGTFYSCRIQVEPDGSAWGVAARMPLVGGDCITLGGDAYCIGAPDAGVLIALERSAEGEWKAVPTTVPFWAQLSVSTSAEGQRLVQHDESWETVIFEHSPLGLREITRLDVIDAFLPRRNIEPPVAVVADWNGVSVLPLEG